MGGGEALMSGSPPPIVAQIFGFFVFFRFSRWFCYGLGRRPLVFWVFLVFPVDLLPLCVGLCLPGTLQIITYITPEHVGGPYMSNNIHQNVFDVCFDHGGNTKK